MALVRNISIAIASFVFVAGCSGSDDAKSTQTLHGRVGTGSGSTSTRSYGGISTANGTAGLRVVAREVHKRGAVGRAVDVALDANGEFRLDVARGARYVVLVESGAKSAMITLGNRNNVLNVSANGGAGTVELGNLKLVGGEARSTVQIDGSSGVTFGAAELDDVFADAAGAIKDAEDAIAEAEKAAAEAIKEAEAAVADAQKAAEDARKAAEEAAKAGR
jgi:hypothetical protein